MEKNKQILSQDECDKMLLNMLPLLKNCESASGGEGTAYFFDQKYVVKEYLCVENWEKFDCVFELYCKEMQEFAQKGFKVPKIYSWLKVPDLADKKNREGWKYKYYILEEYIVGRPLFYGFLEEFYPEMENKVDFNTYFDAVSNPEDNLGAFKTIIKGYVKDYIYANEYVESLPENVLSKFIIDLYEMFTKGKYSLPDMFPSNVIIGNNDINVIDTNYLYGEDGDFNIGDNVDFFICGLFKMFLYNNSPSTIANQYLGDKTNISLIQKSAENLVEKNKTACKAAITRIIAIMNKYIENPVISSEVVYNSIFRILNSFLDKQETQDVLKDIKTKF